MLQLAVRLLQILLQGTDLGAQRGVLDFQLLVALLDFARAPCMPHTYQNYAQNAKHKPLDNEEISVDTKAAAIRAAGPPRRATGPAPRG